MKSIIRKIIATILEIESRLIIKKYKPFIVTVTGSVGKTSAKDAIYSVLAHGDVNAGTEKAVRRSEKSFNSEFGVPLTVLGRGNAWSSLLGWIGIILAGLELIFFRSEYPATLILEVGADHPGDIKRIARWLSPNIAVVTRIGEVPVHIEFFPSREALVEEKLSLAKVATGTLILPADEPDILAVQKGVNGAQDKPTLTYGINTSADVSATDVEIIIERDILNNAMPVGISFKINHAGASVLVTLRGVIGMQHVHPILVAAAVGLARGMTLSAIVEACQANVPPPGRMKLLPGLKGTVIIDDTYNASPDAVREALATIARLHEGRKVVVLGDMMELGKFSPEEHRKVGSLAAKILASQEAEQMAGGVGGTVSSGVATVGDGMTHSLLVTVGQRAKMIAEGAVSAGFPEAFIHSFNTSDEAADEIADMVMTGDIVLIKGSQSPRLERITKVLLDDPARAFELLVRQDAEWLAKK